MGSIKSCREELLRELVRIADSFGAICSKNFQQDRREITIKLVGSSQVFYIPQTSPFPSHLGNYQFKNVETYQHCLTGITTPSHNNIEVEKAIAQHMQDFCTKGESFTSEKMHNINSSAIPIRGTAAGLSAALDTASRQYTSLAAMPEEERIALLEHLYDVLKVKKPEEGFVNECLRMLSQCSAEDPRAECKKMFDSEGVFYISHFSFALFSNKVEALCQGAPFDKKANSFVFLKHLIAQKPEFFTQLEDKQQFLNAFCYHFFNKETSRWMYSLEDGKGEDCNLPFALIASMLLESIIAGKKNFTAILSEYNPIAVKSVYNNIDEVWGKIAKVNKDYAQDILQEKARQHSPGFFSARKQDDKSYRLLATAEYYHQHLKEYYGTSDSDSEGEDYDQLATPRGLGARR